MTPPQFSERPWPCRGKSAEQFVRELIVSLDREHTQDPNYDRLWAVEIKRRWSAYEHGEVLVVENDEALRRIQQAIDRGRQA